MQQQTEELVETKKTISLTQREEDLLKTLKTLIDHIKAYDANGEPSRDFCMGCERNRTLPCVLPQIYLAIDAIEAGFEIVLRPKQAPPAVFNPPFGWRRTIELRKVGDEKPISSTSVRFKNPRMPLYTLTTAVKDLIREQQKTGKIPFLFDINRELGPTLDDLHKLGMEIYEHKQEALHTDPDGEAQ